MKKIFSLGFLISIFILSCSSEADKALKLAIRYNGDAKYYDAIKILDKTIGKNPRDERLFYQRGWSYYCLNKIWKAQKDFDKSIKINPNYWNGYKGLANIFDSKGMYDLAVKYYDKAFKLSPNNERRAVMLDNLASMYGWIKKYDKAIINLNKAIALNDRGSAYFQLGQIYFTKGDKNKAEKTWLTGLKKDFGEIKFKHWIYHKLSGLYEAKKEYRKAFQNIEKAIELSPNDNKYLSVYKYLKKKI